MQDELGGLGGLGGLSDESMRERDLANQANLDMSMSFGEAPSSLGEVDTYGMGEGLSAARESSGLDNDGVSLSAALPDEEEEITIHAALPDEEEENPIIAGRADPSPINAGYGKTTTEEKKESEHTQEVDMSSGEDNGNIIIEDIPSEPVKNAYDEYGNLVTGKGNSKSTADSMANQAIDDIFIANTFSGPKEPKSETGGTMYSGEPKANVNISVGMPRFLKRIIVIVALLGVIYCILEYACGIKLEHYVNPVDVQEYYNIATDKTAQALDVEFKNEVMNYSSNGFDLAYDVENAEGLKIYSYQGKRIFIMVTDFRLNFSIFGVRPYMSKIADAKKALAAKGYELQETYKDTNDYENGGIEYAFYNSNDGTGVFVGKKEANDRIRGIKYVKDYKKYMKLMENVKEE